MAHNKFTRSRRAVDKAGEHLVNLRPEEEGIDQYLQVLNEWRSFHAFPLNTMTMDLKQKVKRIQSGASVVQRLKRTRSIVNKLIKESHMRLTQMQDIGGCRAIVKDVDAVYALKELYINGKSQHSLLSIDDYIRSPKTSGYRSLHLIFKFRSKSHPEYDKLLFEVQLRTISQHAWATAVETVGAVIGQALKASEGEASWLEYFKFASLALEHSEGTIFSTITPHSLGDIARQLAHLGKKLDVEKKLTAYRDALKATEKISLKNAEYFLLVLLPEKPKPQLHIFSYSKKNSEKAFEDYEKYERLLPLYPPLSQLPLFPELDNYSGAQAVLVGAESFKSIRESYPNYYLDTKIFLEKVADFVQKNRRSR